jgi:hypothetical protein
MFQEAWGSALGVSEFEGWWCWRAGVEEVSQQKNVWLGIVTSHPCLSRLGYTHLSLHLHFQLRTLTTAPITKSYRLSSDFHFDQALSSFS